MKGVRYDFFSINTSLLLSFNTYIANFNNPTTKRLVDACVFTLRFRAAFLESMALPLLLKCTRV
jgi:hypothetical protein